MGFPFLMHLKPSGLVRSQRGAGLCAGAQPALTSASLYTQPYRGVCARIDEYTRTHACLFPYVNTPPHRILCCMFSALILDVNTINGRLRPVQRAHISTKISRLQKPRGREAAGLAKPFKIHYLSVSTPVPPGSAAPDSGACPSTLFN